MNKQKVLPPFSLILLTLFFYMTVPSFGQDPCSENKVTFTASSTGATGSIQTWVVPNGVNSVKITAVGADGGDYAGTLNGGSGATAAATFTVNAGDVLEIVVGQAGSPANNLAGGGGGGSGVRNATQNTLLVVAGGGGGDGGDSNGGLGGSAGEDGSNGNGGGGIGGTNGNGGGSGFAGAGGGLFSGGSANGLADGEGGFSATGGTATGNGISPGFGGYGVGGGGAGGAGGGGGGGYSGGGSGGFSGGGGGGGGSFLAPASTDKSISPGVNGNGTENNGYVEICYATSSEPPATIPTMTEWGLILFGLLVFIFALRFSLGMGN